MSDAPETMPETLAAWRFHAANRDEWLEGGWSLEHDRKATSYTRTDHSQALIAAAYEAAEAACTYVIKNYNVMKPDGTTYESLKVQKAATGMVSLAREDIRELTPADAQAALDKLIADAERRGMERAAKIVGPSNPDESVWSESAHIKAAMARLIRAEIEDKT
jgi:hypothetical protein